MDQELKTLQGLSTHRRVNDSMKEIAQIVLRSMNGRIEKHSLRALERAASGEGHEDALSITLAKDPTSWCSDVQMLVKFDYEHSEHARDSDSLDIYKVWRDGVSVEINVQDTNRRTVDAARDLNLMFQRAIDLGQRIQEDFCGSHIELIMTHVDEEKMQTVRAENDRKTKIHQSAIFVLKAEENLATLKVGKTRTADFSGMGEQVSMPEGVYEDVQVGKKAFSCTVQADRKMEYTRTK